MQKNITIFLILASAVVAILLYYSPANRVERNYAAMKQEGRLDLAVLEAYIQLHEPLDDVEYNRALNQASMLDDRYLQKVVERYSKGSFILFTDTAERILSKLPSESVELNLVAGRIYETEEFGLQNFQKAARHLSYAALRGNDASAKHLAKVYLKSNCPVEAATWASVVNANEDASACERMPIDVNRFSEAEWNSVLVNSDRLLQARASGEVVDIEFQTDCPLNNKS